MFLIRKIKAGKNNKLFTLSFSRVFLSQRETNDRARRLETKAAAQRKLKKSTVPGIEGKRPPKLLPPFTRD